MQTLARKQQQQPSAESEPRGGKFDSGLFFSKVACVHQSQIVNGPKEFRARVGTW